LTTVYSLTVLIDFVKKNAVKVTLYGATCKHDAQTIVKLFNKITRKLPPAVTVAISIRHSVGLSPDKK
jgi:hypothetical protein